MNLTQLAYIAEFSAITAAAIALLTHLRKTAGIFLFYTIFCVLEDYFGRYVAISMNGGRPSNHYYYNLCYIVEILLLLYVSYKWIVRRKIHLAIAGIWLSFALMNIAFGEGLWVMNSYSFLLGYIISSWLALWHLRTLSDDDQKPQLSKSGRYVVWIGILLPCVFSMAYRVVEPLTKFDNRALFQSIILTAAIIKYFMLATGILLLWRHQRPSLQYG